MSVTQYAIGEEVSLDKLLDSLPQQVSPCGQDIESTNDVLLDSSRGDREKREVLFDWLAQWQPCLFGRLAARKSKGLVADLCWIDDSDLALGHAHIAQTIQTARRSWKDRAEVGQSSGFLIMFNSERLARAHPSAELIEVCKELSNLYLIEHAPIQTDVIYTEAVPLRRGDGQLTVFKAGCNIFYGSAHMTRNHDRRIPGGLMFSINSPGHYANSLFLRGIVGDLEEAVEFVRETALRSVGNGGLGDCPMSSTSWHNIVDEMPKSTEKKRRPSYIPENVDETRYSALYHTDVLVPTDVTSDPSCIDRSSTSSREDHEAWPYLIIDYITTEQFPQDHVNYGLFHGHPIEDCGKYHNPWQARVAYNSELFDY